MTLLAMEAYNQYWMGFRSDRQGEDVTEYALLLGFIFLVSLCIYLSDAGAVTSIWNTANTVISQGSSSAQRNNPAQK